MYWILGKNWLKCIKHIFWLNGSNHYWSSTKYQLKACLKSVRWVAMYSNNTVLRNGLLQMIYMHLLRVKNILLWYGLSFESSDSPFETIWTSWMLCSQQKAILAQIHCRDLKWNVLQRCISWVGYSIWNGFKRLMHLAAQVGWTFLLLWDVCYEVQH